MGIGILIIAFIMSVIVIVLRIKTKKDELPGVKEFSLWHYRWLLCYIAGFLAVGLIHVFVDMSGNSIQDLTRSLIYVVLVGFEVGLVFTGGVLIAEYFDDRGARPFNKMFGSESKPIHSKK